MVEAVARGLSHGVYGAQADDNDHRQHDGVLNGGWAIVFEQQVFEEVGHGSRSSMAAQRVLLHEPE